MVEVETPAPPPPQASVETAANMSLASSSTEPDSTAEVAPTPPPIAHVYLVAVMSNELRRNAASDHATLGTAIHEMITQTPEPTPTPEKIP
ncbi:MAG: hypothetical protein R3C68_05790 [Myxococcota bacterium]